jgi:hypothetical protein
MADEILIKYDVDVKNLQVSLNKVEKEMLDVDKAAKKTNEDIQKGATKSANEIKKVEKNTKSLSGEMASLASNLPFAGQAMQIIQFGQSIVGVGKAVGGTTNMFKLLKTAIVSTGIGALVLALMGIVQWFTKTDAGAVKLDGIFKTFTLTVNRILKPFRDFAQALFDTGEGAKSFGEILTDLGKGIIDNVINRFKSLLVMGEAIGLFFEGKYKESLKKGTDAMIQLATGVENGTEKISKALDQIARDSEFADAMARAMDEVSDAMLMLSVKAAETNKQIAQLFLQARNRAIDAAERQKLFVKALELERNISEEQIALQQKKIALENEWILASSTARSEEIKEVDKVINGKLQREFQYQGKRITLAEAVSKNLINLTDDELQQYTSNQKELIALEEGRIRRVEKALNGIAALRDADFSEAQQKQQEAFKEQENALKQSLANRLMSEEEYAEASQYNIIKSGDDAIAQYDVIYKRQLELLNELLRKGELSQSQYAGQIKTLNEDTQKRITDETAKQSEARINILKLQQKQELDLYNELQAQIINANKERIDEINSQTVDSRAQLAQSINIFTDIANAEKEINAQAKSDILNQERTALQEQLALAQEGAKEQGELGKKAQEDAIRLAEELKKKEVQIEEEKANEKLEKAKKFQSDLRQVAQAGLQIIGDVADALSQRALDSALANIDAEKNARFAQLDQQAKEQQRLLDAGVISQAQYNARIERLEEKKRQAEANAKKKAFEAQKTAAIVQAIINGALAFTQALATNGIPAGLVTGAIALAAAGAQVAIIASQPTPKFKKGGFIKGASHEAGGVHIEAEGGEYVVNRAQTAKNYKAIEAINSGNFDKFVNETYVLPELKKSMLKNKEIAYNNKNTKLLEMMALNGMVDTSKLERITKGNKTVRIENTSDLASSIADKISKSKYVK